REKDKSFGVIRIIDPIALIKSCPMVISGLIDKIYRQALAWLQLPNLSANALDSQSDIERQRQPSKFRAPLADPGVQRGHEANLMTRASERLGQSPDHVG